MPTPSEHTIVNRILAYLRQRGVWCEKMHGGPMQAAGIPDILGVIPGGRALALEVKRPGGEPTVLQARTLARLRETGALVAVVTSVAEVEALLAPVSGGNE